MPIQLEDGEKMANGQDLPNYSKAGTGKTLSALRAAELSKFKIKGKHCGLVICPQIALRMWQRELESYLGVNAKILRSGRDGPDHDTDWIVTTYDLAAGAHKAPLYAAYDGGALILDEAHYLRRHTSKRTQAVFGPKCDGAGGLMEKFDQVWSLTGNPVWNMADDMWSQLRGLFPDVLETYGVLSYEDFINTFCVSKLRKYHKNMQPTMKIVASQNEPVLRHILYNDIGAIRRLEAPDLPPIVFEQLYPKLGRIPKEYAEMVLSMTEQQLMKALVHDNEDDEFPMQQVWQSVTLAKVKSATEYLKEAAANGPILLGVWHQAVSEAYEKALKDAGCKVARVYGATPQGQREDIRDAFNAGQLDFIVGQMAAMGVSWNLQEACHHVVIAQNSINASMIEQFYKRVYRYGQKGSVKVETLTSDHPLDKMIDKLRRSRERSQKEIVD